MIVSGKVKHSDGTVRSSNKGEPVYLDVTIDKQAAEVLQMVQGISMGMQGDKEEEYTDAIMGTVAEVTKVLQKRNKGIGIDALALWTLLIMLSTIALELKEQIEECGDDLEDGGGVPGDD